MANLAPFGEILQIPGFLSTTNALINERLTKRDLSPILELHLTSTSSLFDYNKLQQPRCGHLHYHWTLTFETIEEILLL